MKYLPLILWPAFLAAQTATTFENNAGLAFGNGKIELVMLPKGGAFVSLVLQDDAAKNNPMWNPARIARDLGQPPRFGASMGHFVCVDGFGPTSQEEQAASLQGHGEAHRLDWEKVSSGKQGSTLSAKFRVTLPLVQETFHRQVELNDGEQVVAVTSELESLLAFDRPINWAEHGTIGSPFLDPLKTVVDASVGRCQTRPYNSARPSPRRLADTKEFHYPMAPLRDGTLVDLRAVPAQPNSMDHTGCAMDLARAHVFVTALHTEKDLLFGYLWRREDYPWLQEWMNYTDARGLARGLEFGTQPYDVPRRQTVETGRMFGVPTFRWLPAKSKIGAKFLMFYTRVPAGMSKVDDVRLEGGAVVIEDKKAGVKVTLPTAHRL
jgi:hypothetical protein